VPARIARDAYLTWPVLIMPYIEASTSYNLFNVSQGYASQSAAARHSTPKVFFCPSKPRSTQISPSSQNPPGTSFVPYTGQGGFGDLSGACGDYACCDGNGSSRNIWKANGAMICGHVTMKYVPLQSGDNGIDQPNNNPPALPLIPITSFTGYTTIAGISNGNGTSKTLLLGEKHVVDGHYGEYNYGDHSFYNGANYSSCQRSAGPGYPLARSINDRPSNYLDVFGGPHTNFCLFAFCDGSVKPLNVNLDTTTLSRLANRNNTAPITVDY
jgi:hypothetical protein